MSINVVSDSSAFDLKAAMADAGEEIEQCLDEVLPEPQGVEARLFEAMRYSVLGGGKRLRPYLVLSGANLFGVDRDCALRAGAAVELIHCYSLVHDDLPAMDDDDLRRGKPTCHKQYDDATAILVGDALQTLAFEILADPKTHADPSVRIRLVTALSQASGGAGMVGGQMMDMIAEERAGTDSFDIGTITRLQRLKTGKLFEYSCIAGAILGRTDETRLHALQSFSHDMGLAFQIADDLLDVLATAEELGKTPGKDEAAGKATFVSILGLERAREQANLLADQAIKHLDIFDERADSLRAVARFVVERKS